MNGWSSIFPCLLESTGENTWSCSLSVLQPEAFLVATPRILSPRTPPPHRHTTTQLFRLSKCQRQTACSLPALCSECSALLLHSQHGSQCPWTGSHHHILPAGARDRHLGFHQIQTGWKQDAGKPCRHGPAGEQKDQLSSGCLHHNRWVCFLCSTAAAATCRFRVCYKKCVLIK